jgi:hypothetical protein
MRLLPVACRADIFRIHGPAYREAHGHVMGWAQRRVMRAIEICRTTVLGGHVELFFKWIKQNLRIKSFFVTSPNAVKTQVGIAACVYVLVAILKKELILPESLHQILQNLSVNAFEKVQIDQLLMKQLHPIPETEYCNQLNLFDF